MAACATSRLNAPSQTSACRRFSSFAKRGFCAVCSAGDAGRLAIANPITRQLHVQAFVRAYRELRNLCDFLAVERQYIALLRTGHQYSLLGEQAKSRPNRRPRHTETLDESLFAQPRPHDQPIPPDTVEDPFGSMRLQPVWRAQRNDSVRGSICARPVRRVWLLLLWAVAGRATSSALPSSSRSPP
jgi:hypothetical protein